jgi:hypothetical protein
MVTLLRTLALVACALLVSSTTLAQDRGKGGPNPDPLGDRDHGQRDRTPAPTKSADPAPAKIKFKQRTVRTVRTTTRGPAEKQTKTTSAKPAIAKASPARAAKP